MSLRDIKRGCYSAAQYAQWRAAGEQEKQQQERPPKVRKKLPVGQGWGPSGGDSCEAVLTALDHSLLSAPEDPDAQHGCWGCSERHRSWRPPLHGCGGALAVIDIDAFYAQVEMIELKNAIQANAPDSVHAGMQSGMSVDAAVARAVADVDLTPLAVTQKNIVVTCNYAARSHGVTKLMAIEEALKRCPELVLRNGEDLARYAAMSRCFIGAVATALEREEKRMQRYLAQKSRSTPIGDAKSANSDSGAVADKNGACASDDGAADRNTKTNRGPARCRIERVGMDELVVDLGPYVSLRAEYMLRRHDIKMLQYEPAAAKLNAQDCIDAESNSDEDTCAASGSGWRWSWSGTHVYGAHRYSDTAAAVPPDGTPLHDDVLAQIATTVSSTGDDVYVTRKGVKGEYADDSDSSDSGIDSDQGNRDRGGDGHGDVVVAGVRLMLASCIVSRLRRAVMETTSLTCSAGVGHNRMFAKFGADMHKPDQQTVFWPSLENCGSYIMRLPMRRFPGVGRSISRQMSQVVEVLRGNNQQNSMGGVDVVARDIMQFPLATLTAPLPPQLTVRSDRGGRSVSDTRNVKAYGFGFTPRVALFIYRTCRGIGDTTVRASDVSGAAGVVVGAVPKSITCEDSFSPHVCPTMSHAGAMLQSLATILRRKLVDDCARHMWVHTDMETELAQSTSTGHARYAPRKLVLKWRPGRGAGGVRLRSRTKTLTMPQRACALMHDLGTGASVSQTDAGAATGAGASTEPKAGIEADALIADAAMAALRDCLKGCTHCTSKSGAQLHLNLLGLGATAFDAGSGTATIAGSGVGGSGSAGEGGGNKVTQGVGEHATKLECFFASSGTHAFHAPPPKAPPPSRASIARHAQQSETMTNTGGVVCPVCEKVLPSVEIGDNAALNAHLDECLNSGCLEQEACRPSHVEQTTAPQDQGTIQGQREGQHKRSGRMLLQNRRKPTLEHFFGAR